MKRTLATLATVGLTVMWACGQDAAGEAKPEQKKHEGGEHKANVAAQMQDIAVTGVLEKMEMKDKEGNAKTRFVLTDASGNKVSLNAKVEGVDLATLVGKTVSVTGKGIERAGKEGKKMIMVNKIDKIEEVTAPAGEAPAAPAAAPAPAAEPAK